MKRVTLAADSSWRGAFVSSLRLAVTLALSAVMVLLLGMLVRGYWMLFLMGWNWAR